MTVLDAKLDLLLADLERDIPIGTNDKHDNKEA